MLHLTTLVCVTTQLHNANEVLIGDCFLAGVKTGPVTGQPPSPSSETTSELLKAAHDDTVGQHESGHDGGDKSEEKKVKSEKERTNPG